jgi:uncharacterized membrane protein
VTNMNHSKINRWLIICGFSATAVLYGWIFFRWLGWHHLIADGQLANGIQTLSAERIYFWLFGILALLSIGRILRLAQRIPPNTLDWQWIAGRILQGAGLWLVVDGVILHLTLDYHHVRFHQDAVQMMFEDLLWIGFGVLLSGIGSGLLRARAIGAQIAHKTVSE